MRRVAGFAGRFIIAYSVVVTLWVAGLEQRYNDFVAWTCRHLLAAAEEPHLTTNVRRAGNVLVIDHVSQFASLPPDEIVTRRVHSNTALFVALTLATPTVGWGARGLWLAGGTALLSASHVGHVLAYVHHHYALHNVGPYFTTMPLDQIEALGLRQLWTRPAALRRRLVLAIANVFNIVLQRVVPIVLWLPLFLGTLWCRNAQRIRDEPARAGTRRRRALVVGAAATLFTSGLATVLGDRPAAPDVIEGLRLGMSAVEAKRILEEHGYDWIASSYGPHGDRGVWVGVVDVWPRRGPLTENRYGPRYNWIGLRIAQRADALASVFSVCVTGIRTVPSDARPERYRLEPRDPAAPCADYWRSLERAP